jgi:hypothetical protein
MHSKILASLGLIGTVISASAFAEPPIQPGDTWLCCTNIQKLNFFQVI